MSEHQQSPDAAPPANAPPELVRRHHTLSTSSRLVRLERSRARVALEGAGLSEQDREFYVPESPIDGPPNAWSDLGHATATRPTTLSALGAHSRTTSGSGNTAAAWASSEPLVSPGGGYANQAATPFLPRTDSPATAFYSSSPPGSAKRSSFVVLRGGKGDAALTERRAAPGDAPLSPRSTLRNITPPRPNLEHRNSLKPFLEQDAEDPGEQEEWERSIQHERAVELQRADDQVRPCHASSGRAKGLTQAWCPIKQRSSHYVAPYTTPPLSQSSAFNSRGGSPFTQHSSSQPHTRANTLSHTHSIASITSSEAWNGAGLDDVGVLRRHHSLDFRSDAGTNGGGDNSSDEGGWASHDRHSVSEDLLAHSHALAGGFASSRAGAGPPALNLTHPSAHGSSSPHSSLSNSNSLNSHTGRLSHSNSLNSSNSHGHSGPLSPVGGFPRSPWSPTVEETKQLGMGAVVGTPPPTLPALSRGGSSSSRGSSGGRYGSEEVGRLGDGMAALDVSATVEHEAAYPKPPTPPGLDIRAALQSNAFATKTDNLIRQPVRSMTASTISPNRRLPPLMTNPDVLASLSGAAAKPALPNSHAAAFASRQGPASAAAYVPPIGHSHLPPQRGERGEFLPSITEPNRGNFTAAPGGGGNDWSTKKAMLIGSGPASAFPTAVGVNPLADAWPAGGGFGVGLAMQQQQQIQILQSQMQAALQAMDLMKAQGHALPPGFGSATTPTGRPFVANGTGLASTFAGGLPSAGVTPTGPPHQQAGATADSPIDIPSLIATKGYNPQNFDLRPPSVRASTPCMRSREY